MKADLMATVFKQPLRNEFPVTKAGNRPAPLQPADPLLNARDAAMEVGLSLPAFWRGVGNKRLPAPVYPAPRAPRWYRSELRSAVEATRALPAEAKAQRRADKFKLPNSNT
jgi:predicted DNA-binding transcriptional regulator AlpA